MTEVSQRVHSAGQPSRWASAHILVICYFIKLIDMDMCVCHYIHVNFFSFQLHLHPDTTTTQQPSYGLLSRTTRVSRYQKKHSPTHHLDHYPIFISFFRLPRSIASSLFKLRAWQSFHTTSFHVLFGLLLGLELSISYAIHFFTQSVSSFRSTCPYHRNLFCCGISIISSIPSLSLHPDSYLLNGHVTLSCLGLVLASPSTSTGTLLPEGYILSIPGTPALALQPKLVPGQSEFLHSVQA